MLRTTTAVMILATLATLPVFAAEAQVELVVTGRIESAIQITINHAPGETPHAPTPGQAVQASLGTFSKFTPPADFVQSRATNDWAVFNHLNLTVERRNLGGTTYTLAAKLLYAPAEGITWKVEGIPISSDGFTSVRTGVQWDGDTSARAWEWRIVVANNVRSAVIDNTLILRATAD